MRVYEPPPTVHYPIYMTVELYERVKGAAASRGQSAAAWIRQTLADQLERESSGGDAAG